MFYEYENYDKVSSTSSCWMRCHNVFRAKCNKTKVVYSTNSAI